MARTTSRTKTTILAPCRELARSSKRLEHALDTMRMFQTAQKTELHRLGVKIREIGTDRDLDLMARQWQELARLLPEQQLLKEIHKTLDASDAIEFRLETKFR